MYKKFILLAVLQIMPTYALKIDRVIVSSDSNPEYIEFWPIVAKAWKEIVGVKPTLALIGDANTKVDETLGDVIRFDPIEGVSTALQAQTIRLLLPACFPDEVCITSDIDLIPLNKNYFLNSVSYIADDCFVVYRNGAYAPESKQYPMCFLAAKGNVFKEVFKIENLNNIPKIIKSWSDENLGWSTDELILYRYLNNWEHFRTRCIKLNHTVENRIDRSCWTFNQTVLNKKLYIDAHCPRPYSKFKNEIDSLVETILNSQEKNITSKKSPDLDTGSHMPGLITAVINTDGPILEMGSGDFSTPLLHALCSRNKRYLLSTDTDKKWLDKFVDLKNDYHDFLYIPVYEDDWSVNPKPKLWDNIGSDKHWSVVLIDHRPGERRVEDIRRLRKNTDIFVVHDTQQPTYFYEPVLNSFKYKYVYERYSTQTTIVSDVIDVAKFFGN